jgi:hypothetical protein
MLACNIDVRDLQISASATARRQGFVGASALEADLRRRGLPPFRSLVGGLHIVQLHEALAAESLSLANWSLAEGKDPSVYYRYVRRQSGLPWSNLKSLETRAVKLRVLSRWLLDGLQTELLVK